MNPKESAQEELYHKYSTELDEPVRQLATFIAKTGFNDVSWRNIPILNKLQDSQDPWRIGLIDLESMGNILNGFIGDSNNKSCGLIGCVSEAQIDIVLKEAINQGTVLSEKAADRAKSDRVHKIDSNRRLQAFHEKNGIKTGREPIKVDLESLGLDLTETDLIKVPVRDENGQMIAIIVDGEKQYQFEEKTITLREVAEDVIAKMNKAMQEDFSPQESIQGKRYFVLETNDKPWITYKKLGLSASSYETQSWLHRITNALTTKGCIFNADRHKHIGYIYIQA